jgi:alpha-amylase
MKRLKKILLLLFILVLGFGVTACKKPSILDKYSEEYPKNDIYYQIFVRSFADSNDDGIGDLNGVINKLDYLQELGVTALWLTPIHPTTSYHGYEISNYYEINPEFGTMEDFENLIIEAGKVGIKIVMDTVFNHTADNNPWYLEALDNLNSPYREFYNWISNIPGAHSYGTFPYSRDLNLKSDKVIEELANILKFYSGKGVAGFRFDAVKHFFGEKPYDANYSNNPHFQGGLVLRKLKQEVTKEYPDVYFVGENFTYSYNDYQFYYMGADSMFNFKISEYFQQGAYANMQIALQNMYRALGGFNPNFIDAPFITNHDLDRYASMQPDIGRQKLSASILLTLPGNPFIYYGEELGMKGRRIEGATVPGYVDKDGKPLIAYDEARRQPFLWDENDKALTTWFPLIHGNESVARYGAQKEDENSLYNHYANLIKTRKENPALMYGNSFIKVDGISSTVAFIRQVEIEGHSQIVLVIHNTSNQVKEVSFDVVKDIYGTQSIPPYGTYIAEISSLDKVN